MFDLEKFSVILLALLLATSASANEVYVRPNSSSICPGEPCLLLDDYAKNVSLYFTPGTEVLFLSGEHVLNSSFNMENAINITLTGNKTKIFILHGGRISMPNTVNVTLNLLQLEYEHSATVDVLLSITSSNSTVLNNVSLTITSKTGAIVVIMTSNIKISNCSFFGSKFEVSRSDLHFSGDNKIMNSSLDVPWGSIIVFTGINTFCYNKWKIFSILGIVEFHGITIFRENHICIELVYGGAVRIYDIALFDKNFAAIRAYSGTEVVLSGNMTFSNHNNEVMRISKVAGMNCTGEIYFNNNTIAESISGVIYIEVSRVNFSGTTTFIDNSAMNISSGVVFAGYASIVHFSGFTTFINNSGINGGAIYAEASDVILTGTVYFINNRADGSGGAINHNALTTGSIVLKGNVNFLGNRAGESGGAIFLNRATLHEEGNISFINNIANNRGGAIYALDNRLFSRMYNIHLSGNAWFENNKAQSGGAIVFDGDYTISFVAPVVAHFIRNEAKVDGGALLFLDPNSITVCENNILEVTCFFSFQNFSESERIALTFSENSAGHGGNVLYGGAIDQCSVDLHGENVSGFIAFHNVSTVIPNGNVSSSDITSDPLKVCFCDEIPDCSLNIDPVSVRRGETFKLFVASVGQADMPVPSTIRAYILNNDNQSELSQLSHKSETQCSGVEFRVLSNANNKSLVLYPDGPCGSTVSASKTIQVIFEDCPAGFDFFVNRCICEKRLHELNPANACDIDSELIERPSGTWIKPIWIHNESYAGFILSRYCPSGYCNESIKYLDFSFDANDTQCHEN